MTVPAVIRSAVEGAVDEAVAVRLVEEVGAQAGTVYGKSGKVYLRQRVAGYNNAARTSPWLVLVDLDADECAATLRDAWLPTPAPLMRLRVAVREVEAWLLADRERFARLLGVQQTALPRDPESVDDPKQLVVNLARGSARRDIREDLVPRPKSGRTTGPLYGARMIEFAIRSWRPRVAAASADSLRRCLVRLEELTTLEATGG